MHRDTELTSTEVSRRSLLRLGAAGLAGGVAALGLTGGAASAAPVSYTHLTLPTILLV